MEKTLSIISNIAMFKGLSKDELQKIQNIAQNRLYVRGKTIFIEGDESNGFYVVVDGRVKIYKVSIDGKEQILHIYGHGDPFGEVPVFSGGKFPANAQAILKSNLLFFPKDAFAKLISENPSLSMNMLAVLSMRLRQFSIQVENLSLKEVPGRLAAYIVYLTEKELLPEKIQLKKGKLAKYGLDNEQQEYKTSVTLQISKGQLASLLGTIPETLSRILAKMSNHNLIEVNGKNIKILDHNGLKELAEHGKL